MIILLDYKLISSVFLNDFSSYFNFHSTDIIQNVCGIQENLIIAKLYIIP